MPIIDFLEIFLLYLGTVRVRIFRLYKDQEEQRLKLLKEMVANNKTIMQLETGLLNRLTSTYRCIINDTDFICGLAETKVSRNLTVK